MKTRKPYFRELHQEDDERVLALAERLLGEYDSLIADDIEIKLICFCNPDRGGEWVILVPQVVSKINGLQEHEKSYLTNLLLGSIREQRIGLWLPSKGESLMSRTYRRVPHWAKPDEPLSRHERSRSSKFPEVGRFYHRLKAGLVRLWEADDVCDRDRVRARHKRAEKIDQRLDQE